MKCSQSVVYQLGYGKSEQCLFIGSYVSPLAVIIVINLDNHGPHFSRQVLCIILTEWHSSNFIENK